MNPEPTMMLHLLDEQEDWLDEDELHDTAAATAFLLTAGGIIETTARIDRRRPHRAYLRRPQLLPTPRHATPWTALYESRADSAYIVTMGVDVRAFDLVLNSGFAQRWNTEVIPRHDAPGQSAPRPERRSLDAAGALGLVLHYLNSTMREISLQQIFALIPSTVSRYIDFGMSILLETLRSIPEGAISWPSGGTFEEYARLVRARHALLEKAFGSIDGLKMVGCMSILSAASSYLHQMEG